MDTNEPMFTVSYPPHITGRRTISWMFAHRFIALIPIISAAIYHFRLAGLKVMLVALVTALIAEAGMQRAMKRKITLTDGSAAFSALVLACLVPSTTPWWVVMMGALVAMVLGKHLFGGLGNNPFMDALVGWVFIRLSWPERISGWVETFDGWIPDPPLYVVKFEGLEALVEYEFQFRDLFLGIQAGGIGTGCGLAILIGGIYMSLTRVIDWRIPLGFLTAIAVIATSLWLASPAGYVHPLFQILGGSALFGAFFIATDPVTSPSLRWAKFLFGVLCGMLVMAIRLWGSHPDGVVFAIFVANAATPLLNKITHRPFGLRGKS